MIVNIIFLDWKIIIYIIIICFYYYNLITVYSSPELKER